MKGVGKMHKKIWLVILCLLVLASFIGAAFAVTQMIKAEDGGILEIRRNGVQLFIPPGALEKDTNISAVMSLDQSTEPKTLVFEFGPSGTTFAPSAELRIDKKFFQESDVDDIKLYSEDGEEIDAVFSGNSEMLIFYLDHFSYYYYRRR
jgi:hypothetical protein